MEYSVAFIEIPDREAPMEEPVAYGIVSVEIIIFITQTLLPIGTFFPY